MSDHIKLENKKVFLRETATGIPPVGELAAKRPNVN